MSEFLVGVPVVAQQQPPRNQGGDCFAASTLAAMRHFYGDKAPSYDQCWEAFERDQDGRKYLNNTWPGMRGALYNLCDNWPLDIHADAVAPQLENTEHRSYPWGPAVDGYEYARRLEGWLRSGYLALSEIMMNGCKTGPFYIGPDGKRYQNHIDHFVLYDGVRSGWRKHETVEGASVLVHQIHVVCSAKGGRAYWIDVDDLLIEHGAGAWWLIRPRQHADLPGVA